MIWNPLHLFKSSSVLHFFVAFQFCFAAIPKEVFAQKKNKDSFFKQYAKSESNLPQAKLQSTDSSQLYLVKFKIYPTSGLGKEFEVLKVLGPLHYIVRAKTNFANNEKVVEYIIEANSNWKVTGRLLKELGRIRSKDSLLIKAQIHQLRQNQLDVTTSKR